MSEYYNFNLITSFSFNGSTSTHNELAYLQILLSGRDHASWVEVRMETVDNNISADEESVPAHVPNYDLKSAASAVQKYMLFEIHDDKDDTSNRSSVMTNVFLRIYSNIFCNSQKSDIYENQMYVQQNNVSVDQWTVKSSLNFTFENNYIVHVSGCLNKVFVTTNQTIKVRWLNINSAHYGHLEELQPKKC